MYNKYGSGAAVCLLLCGSFNPPTLMHRRMLHLAKFEVEKQFGWLCKKAIVSPVSDEYQKEDLVSGDHRLEMLRYTFNRDTWVHISDYEVRYPTWQSTLNVFQYYKGLVEKEDEHIKMVIVCGADTVLSMMNPKIYSVDDIEKLLSWAFIAVITRNTGDNRPLHEAVAASDIFCKYKESILIINEWFGNEISSTKVRDAIKTSTPIEIVNDSAFEYIKTHKLYT